MIRNGVILPPISLSGDVYALLGISPGASGYDLGLACKNAKINPYARYKPVRMASPTASVPGSPGYNPEWWKGRDNNCGLRSPVQGTGSDKDWMRCASEEAKFVYEPPQGKGAVAALDSPYRLSDFNGYNHFALCPVTIEFDNEFELSNVESLFDCTLWLSESDTSWDESMLSLSDMGADSVTDFGDMFFTIAIRNATSGKVMFFQSYYNIRDSKNEDCSRIRVSLQCTTISSSSALDSGYSNLGYSVNVGETMQIYAFLGTKLIEATDMAEQPFKGECMRSISPSRWSSLYFKDRPYSEVVVTSARRNIHMDAIFSNVSMSITTQNGRGVLQVSSVTFGLKYAQSQYVQCRIYATIVNDTSDYLIEGDNIIADDGTVNVRTSTTGAVQVHNIQGAALPFLWTNEEIINNNYGNRFKITLQLRAISSDIGINGVLSATAILNPSTGNWSVTL